MLVDTYKVVDSSGPCVSETTVGSILEAKQVANSILAPQVFIADQNGDGSIVWREFWPTFTLSDQQRGIQALFVAAP